MFLTRKLIFCLLLVLVAALNAGADEWIIPDGFTVFAWSPPPFTEAHIGQYMDAHMNTILVPTNDIDRHAPRFMAERGLDVILTQPEKAGLLSAEWVARANEYRSVKGWLVHESVRKRHLPKVTKRIEDLRELDPSRVPIVTLPSKDADPQWIASMSKLLQAGMPVLWQEGRTMMEDGLDDTERFYKDLDITRRAAAKLSIPFWGAVQVTAKGKYRRASESDIRVQVYSYLASGGRGLCYYDYWPESRGDGEAEPAMVEPATRRGLYGWEMVEAVNREVAVLAPYLLGLKCVNTYMIGDAPQGSRRLEEDVELILKVDAEKAMLGVFSSPKGDIWAMIVNRKHGKQRSSMTTTETIDVSLDEKVKKATIIDILTGEAKSLLLDKGKFSVSLPGGTGCLIKLDLI